MESTNLIKFLCASANELLRAPVGVDAQTQRMRLDEAAEMLNLAARLMARQTTNGGEIDRRAA